MINIMSVMNNNIDQIPDIDPALYQALEKYLSMRGTILLIHSDFEIVWSNQYADLAFLGGENCSGHNLHEFVSDEFHGLMDLRNNHIQNGRPVREIEVTYKGHGGTRLYVRSVLFPVVWRGQSATLALAWDVTEIRARDAIIFGLLARRLSPREMQYMRLRAVGKGLREISREMDIEITSVRTYHHRIMGKLDATESEFDALLGFFREQMFYNGAGG